MTEDYIEWMEDFLALVIIYECQTSEEKLHRVQGSNVLEPKEF